MVFYLSIPEFWLLPFWQEVMTALIISHGRKLHSLHYFMCLYSAQIGQIKVLELNLSTPTTVYNNTNSSFHSFLDKSYTTCFSWVSKHLFKTKKNKSNQNKTSKRSRPLKTTFLLFLLPVEKTVRMFVPQPEMDVLGVVLWKHRTTKMYFTFGLGSCEDLWELALEVGQSSRKLCPTFFIPALENVNATGFISSQIFFTHVLVLTRHWNKRMTVLLLQFVKYYSIWKYLSTLNLTIFPRSCI